MLLGEKVVRKVFHLIINFMNSYRLLRKRLQRLFVKVFVPEAKIAFEVRIGEAFVLNKTRY